MASANWVGEGGSLIGCDSVIDATSSTRSFFSGSLTIEEAFSFFSDGFLILKTELNQVAGLSK